MGRAAENILGIEFEPAGNRNLLQYSVLAIRVRVVERERGGSGPLQVVIRTNLNQGHRIRRQIIDLVERGQSYSTDYYDIPAAYEAATDQWCVDVLLSEVGYFEFKVRVESGQGAEPWVRWTDGPNVGVSVQPLEYRRCNAIYGAFIRQYVGNKHLASLKDAALEGKIAELAAEGAFVIPPGGDFEQFKQALPFIVNELGMRIIHLLPINPVPTSYGRMGMYGSPYATTDYFGVEPTYATFSRYKTMEEQVIDLTSTIHGLGAKVILDMVINHTGWASSIHFVHRHWHKTDAKGMIVSPGAWGVVWGDLVELDYQHQDLWRYLAEVLLAWCRRGIDGFRLDAGYMIPQQVWQYLISRVREEFPNCLFLLEGLGGSWEATEVLLTQGQMNWAYSELFQNYTRRQIVDYLEYAQRVSGGKGVLVHYAETHDNERLATKGRTYARLRVLLSALTSFGGAWGFTNGVEWLATEKIDVHRNAGLHWGNPDNLVAEIGRVNRILAENPAFWGCDNLRLVDLGNEDLLAFTRSSADGENRVACVLNLNVAESRSFRWDLAGSALGGSGPGEGRLRDLFSQESREAPADGVVQGDLGPGGCLLVRYEPAGAPARPRIAALYDVEAERVALIYRILLARFQSHEMGRIDQERLLRGVDDWRRFIALVQTTSLNQLARGDLGAMLHAVSEDQVRRHSAVWTFHERSKEFLISGQQWLAVHTYLPCTAYLKTAGGTVATESLPSEDGVGHYSYFGPQGANQPALLTFNWKITRDHRMERLWQEAEYPVRWLPADGRGGQSGTTYPLRLAKRQLKSQAAAVVLTNGLGAVCVCPALPGRIDSKYDTLLSIAPDGQRPTERLALVKALQETVRVEAKYFDLDESFLSSFTRYPQPCWEFVYDDGQYYLRLERTLLLPHGQNQLCVRYDLKEANAPIALTCKCFLECRSPHEQVQASASRQAETERACRVLGDRPGLEFAPRAGVSLRVLAQRGEFLSQPHWIRDWHFPADRLYGLEDRGDVFAPGVFVCELGRGESQTLVFTAEGEGVEPVSAFRAASLDQAWAREQQERLPLPAARKDPLVRLLLRALDQFLVRTAGGWQVVSGYPWLGAGTRESLGCVGGLLAAGQYEAARDVVAQAARSEERGMLWDWLTGGPAERTGLEPSLRLFLAAQECVKKHFGAGLWDALLGDGRTLGEVLARIYEVLRDGTCPVARLDEESGLLACRAGATWMNTTHPQATPRGGYPVEIEALWYQALGVLGELFPPYAGQARELRGRIEELFEGLFWDERRGYLADVLIAEGGVPAGRAAADPALRFNQLAAVQAGLVRADRARRLLEVVASRLVAPAGVRSLSPEPLLTPLVIMDDQGRLLGDPRVPYRGRCAGTEKERRLAYHNGTAWTWAYLSFVEARARADGMTQEAVEQGLTFLEPIWSQLGAGAVGSLPEMKEGDYPHAVRGCPAYALSVAEALRVYLLLRYRQEAEGGA